MQNRYVADVGDYVKFAILRALAYDRRVGIAWWLYPDEPHNGDGGHRQYLTRPDQWKRFDPILFETLLRIEEQKQRDVRALEAAQLLPNAVFASDPVPCDVRPFTQRPAARQQWLSAIRQRFLKCNLLFLDPDNGLAPQRLRPTCRRAGKSVFIEDIRALAASGRAIVLYHHHTRYPGGHRIEIGNLAEQLRTSEFQVSGVLRAKPWSPRAFFIINGDKVLVSRAERIEQTWGSSIEWLPEPMINNTSCDETPNKL